MDDRRPREPHHTVLFVDDDPDILAGLQGALRRYPFVILTATSGAQALKVLETHAVDVVVSDERMPNMAGSEFLAIVRQKHPETVRIVLTGEASLAAAIRAINEGEVYRFLSKPCSPVDLAGTIQHALQQKPMARETAQLFDRTREQHEILRDLEHRHPGISEVKRNVHGAIVLDELTDADELIRQIELGSRR